MAPSIELPTDPGAGGRLSQRAGVTDVMMGRRPGVTAQMQAKSSRHGSKYTMEDGPKKQKTALPEDFTLPSWIEIDAHLTYKSRSLNKDLEVIVEMVDSKRSEVELSFVNEALGRKLIPFAVIASEDNPLTGIWVEEKPSEAASADGPAVGPELPASSGDA